MTLMKRSTDLFPGLLDDFFGRDLFNVGVNKAVTTPAVNIKETDDNFEVEMAAPGMEKKDFNVELENDFNDLLRKRA